MIDRLHLIRWVAATIIATIGILQNNTGAVIGSMMISTIATVYTGVLEKPRASGVLVILGLLVLGVVVGYVGTILTQKLKRRPPTVERQSTTANEIPPNEIPNQIPDLAKPIVHTQVSWASPGMWGHLVLSFLVGILLKQHARDDVLSAGTSVAITIGPSVTAIGVLFALARNDQDKRHYYKLAKEHLLVVGVNFLGIGLAHALF